MGKTLPAPLALVIQWWRGRIWIGIVDANEFFYRESLAAGSLDQLPAPLEHILADA